MKTIQLQHNISDEQYQMAVRLLEAINIKVKQTSQADDAKMSKEAFYAKIDEALEQEPIPMTRNELHALHRL